jgi:hypothetical protein
METKEKYEELMKKHNLPSFEVLDNDFEINGIEDQMLLRGIRKKISDKVDYYAHLLDSFMQPDNSFSSLYEIDAFTDLDRENLMSLYKKMMILQRELVKLNLNFGEEVDAKFIKGFFDEWKQLKKDLAKIIEKVQSSWCTDDLKGFNIDYLG